MLRASSSSSSSSAPPSSPRLAFVAPRPLPSPPPPLPLELTRSQLLNKLARPASQPNSPSNTTFTRTDLTALVHSFLVAAASPPSGLTDTATPQRWVKPFIQTFLYVSRSIRSIGEDEPGRLLLDSLPSELRKAVQARCGCARRVKVPLVLLGKRRRAETEKEEKELPFPKMETLIETAFELLKEARERPAAPPSPPPPSTSASAPTVVPLGAGHTFAALRALYGRSTADRWSRQFATAVGFDPDKPLAPSTVVDAEGGRKLETIVEEGEKGDEVECREGPGRVRKKARRRSNSVEEHKRETLA